MKNTIIKQTKTTRIVGLQCESVSNQNPQPIGALWQRAMAEGVVQPGEPSYCIYDSYESDHQGTYRVVIGRESDAPLEGDQVEVIVPTGDYARFEAQGTVPEVAMKTWQHIWTAWPDSARRNYQVDLERYVGPPNDCQLEILIGLKASQ